MKRTAITALLLALLLLLSGCAGLPSPGELLSRFAGEDGADPGEGLLLYRRAAEPSEGGLIRTERFLSQGDGADPEALLAAFAAPGGNEALACALPPDTEITDWRVEDGLMTLTLSDGFLEASEMDRSAAAMCAALTLCQLETVDALSVSAGGRVLFSGLVPEDALLDPGETDPYVRRLRLYFPDGEGRYLVSEYHSLTLDEETPFERYVVEELLRGPNSGELRSAIPRGTSLLSCGTEDGVCTVDLSRAFYTGRPRTAREERLVIYSLVDSLTALSSVDSVRILVEGESLSTYVYRSLSQPLEPYDRVIGPASDPEGELDADLYLPLPGMKRLAPLPFRVSTADHDSAAEAVLAELMSAREPGYPAPFTGGAAALSTVLQGSLCTVDLPESFFVSLSESDRKIAVASIAATLCSLPEVAAVRLAIGGGDAVFEGTDWSGPWQGFDDIITE